MLPKEKRLLENAHIGRSISRRLPSAWFWGGLLFSGIMWAAAVILSS